MLFLILKDIQETVTILIQIKNFPLILFRCAFFGSTIQFKKKNLKHSNLKNLSDTLIFDLWWDELQSRRAEKRISLFFTIKMKLPASPFSTESWGCATCKRKLSKRAKASFQIRKPHLMGLWAQTMSLSIMPHHVFKEKLWWEGEGAAASP